MNTIILSINNRSPVLLSHFVLCIQDIIKPPPEIRERNIIPNSKLILL